MFGQLLFLIETGIVLGVCVLVIVALNKRLEIPRRLSQLLIGAFALRVVIAGVVDHLGVFAEQYDFFFFDRVLWQTAQLVRDGVLIAPVTVAAASGDLFVIPYSIVYGPVYVVFGHHTLLARFVFALVGTVFVLNVYRLGDLLNGPRVGLYAAGFTAIYPYWLYLSVIFYRDMLILVVLTELMYRLTRLVRSQRSRDVVGVGLLTVVSIMLRPENVLPIGVAFAVAGYFLVREYTPVVKGAILAAIASVTVGVLKAWGVSKGPITISELSEKRQFLTRHSGAYLSDVIFDSVVSLLAFVPVGSMYFLLVPLPWQIHNVLALLAFVENIVMWYPAVLLSVVGCLYAVVRRPALTFPLVAFAIAGVVSYGIFEGNMGPALRHRSQFQFVFVVFAAIAVVERINVDISTDVNIHDGGLR